MEKFLFFILCLPLYASAQSVTLTQSAKEYVSTNYEDTLAESIAIDEGRKLVYVTGGQVLNIFKLGFNDSLKLLKTQMFDENLGQVRWCANFITIIMQPIDAPGNSTLEVFKVYNKKSGADIVSVNSVPLGYYPGSHRHSADCKTVIVPISAFEYVGNSTVDEDGMIKVIQFSKANLAISFTTTDLAFDSFEMDKTRLESEGGLFEATVGFAEGLEPNSLCMGVNDTMAYVILQSNNLVATIDVAGLSISALNGLGFVDFSTVAFDPNDKDGIGLANYPIQGAYSPSGIECFTSEGVDYFYTVNGGMPLYRNLERLSSITLDPTAFPDTAFQSNALAGRLNIWGGGDTDGDGDYDVLILPGARSVSVFQAAPLTLVANSGDDMEASFASDFPDFFNSDSRFADKTIGDAFDFRSNNRGPEPKSLAVFSTCKDRYLVVIVGFGMPGGIKAYTVNLDSPSDGFTSQELLVNIDNYMTTDVWGDVWANGTASLLEVKGLTLYPGRSPVLLSASARSGTVEAFKVNVKCSG